MLKGLTIMKTNSQRQEQLIKPSVKPSSHFYHSFAHSLQILSTVSYTHLSRQYELKPNNRIFTVTKSGMHHEMDRGCRETGVKRIRIHDLRHSHVSLLIEMGFSAVDIANRVGHESVKITYRYAHMFPSKDKAIADKLTDFRGGAFNE